ncbi:MAG TPA: nickel insertion protein, partial [Pirellulales bacterium]|nr:nickel insertion protein [Pirellulales bacterium]
MKIAYLDCISGISGDMTLAALVDVGVPLAAINAGVQSLGLPGVRLVATEVKRHGFRATQITVEHEPEH